KTTRQAQSLSQMEPVMPWERLCALFKPHYPKGGKSVGDRPPVPLDLGRERVPDETVVCKFRHLLEKHKLGERLFKAVTRHARARGIKVSRGTIVYVSIISSPGSTKSWSGERPPAMHQTTKGKQWLSGIKAHISGVSKEKIIHSVKASGATVSESPALLPHLLHGKETQVYGNLLYRGQADVIHRCVSRATDSTNRRDRYSGQVDETERRKNRTKSKIRSRVERACREIKGLSGLTKARYQGLAKNLRRQQTLCALANLFTVRRHLLAG